jgi:hypothetical protein
MTLRISSLGVISFTSVGLALGCAGLLGIEDASCDVSFDPRCADIDSLQPGPAAAGQGSGGFAGAASASAGSGGSAGASGAAAGSSGSGAGGASGASGAGGAPMMMEPEPSEPLCERYCNAVAAACTGENEQYASPAACREVCAALEPGEPGGFSANTVECRLARAELAQATGEPGEYCHTAGPGGGGVCGDDCEGFCAVMAQTCTLMGSFEECLPLCAEVPNLAVDPDDVLFPGNVTYDTTIQSGDSVQCRLYHVTAATLDPVIHCSHAAGVALCAPPTLPSP